VAAQLKSASQSRSRLDRLRLFLSHHRADAILVSHLPNIHYLCGFTGSSALLLIEGSRGTLFTDSRYTFQARKEVSGVRVQITKTGLIAAASEALRSGRKGRRTAVAYSPFQLTVGQMDALHAGSGKHVRWVKAPNAVESLRAIKDAGELTAMKDAAELISNVFGSILPLIRPGVSELMLSGAIEFAMKELGATGPSFETIVASGPRSAWAHARPSSKPLRKNELVVLDQGAILRGYCSDMTRTVFLGRSSPRVRRMYAAVLEAQQAAKDAIRPGVTAGSVDAAARRVLKGYGLASKFTHSTGHGLGLEVHEMPRLGRGEATILQQGMVLTVEPGVYVEGFGGIRIEDDIVVTSKGAQDLTSASREFLEL
jgi:Xaa-Pro aminopeptidase